MVQGVQVLAAKLDAQNPYGGRRTDLMRYVHPYAHTGPPTVNNSFHKCQIKQNQQKGSREETETEGCLCRSKVDNQMAKGLEVVSPFQLQTHCVTTVRILMSACVYTFPDLRGSLPAAPDGHLPVVANHTLLAAHNLNVNQNFNVRKDSESPLLPAS